MKPITCFLILGAVILTGCLASAPDTPPVYENPPAIDPPESLPTDLPAVGLPNVTGGTSQPVFESQYAADEISPILYGNSQNLILLGATAQDTWVHPTQIYGLLYEDQTYDFYSSDEFMGSGLAHVKADQNQGPPGTCEYYEVEQSLKDGEPPSFGFKEGQPLEFRLAKEIAADNALYQQYVSDWLALQQVSSPVVNVTRILSVDLEGDGADEVLISASYFAEQTGHMAGLGDYSIIIMRKVVGNEVRTVPLVSQIHREDPAVQKFPPTYSLDKAFDLNGDGTLEVIVTGSWWEGSGVYVYEVQGLDVTEALKVTCGLVAQN